MFPFVLEDFEPRTKRKNWHKLPPIAAHIRWLKLRLRPHIPSEMTPELFTLYCRAWDYLVDSEFILQHEAGFSPHGFSETREIPQNIPQAMGTEVMHVSVFCEQFESEMHCKTEKETAPSIDDEEWLSSFAETSKYIDEASDDTDGDYTDRYSAEYAFDTIPASLLANLLAVKGWTRIADAEAYLLGARLPVWEVSMADEDGFLDAAWHALAEATELANRVEALLPDVLPPVDDDEATELVDRVEALLPDVLPPVDDDEATELVDRVEALLPDVQPPVDDDADYSCAVFHLYKDYLEMKFNGHTTNLPLRGRNDLVGLYYLAHILNNDLGIPCDLVKLAQSRTNMCLRETMGISQNGPEETEDYDAVGRFTQGSCAAPQEIYDDQALNELKKKYKELESTLADLDSEIEPEEYERKEIELKNLKKFILESHAPSGTKQHFRNSDPEKIKRAAGQAIKRAIKKIIDSFEPLGKYLLEHVKNIHSGSPCFISGRSDLGTTPKVKWDVIIDQRNSL